MPFVANGIASPHHHQNETERLLGAAAENAIFRAIMLDGTASLCYNLSAELGRLRQHFSHQLPNLFRRLPCRAATPFTLFGGGGDGKSQAGIGSFQEGVGQPCGNLQIILHLVFLSRHNCPAKGA